VFPWLVRLSRIFMILHAGGANFPADYFICGAG